MSNRAPADALIFDLGYGLWRAGVKLPIDECRRLGARVLDHLKLARWEFTRPPPAEPHGSALPAGQTDVAAQRAHGEPASNESRNDDPLAALEREGKWR